MVKTRIERDTFGDIEVPADRLWGAQTQRSMINFRFPGEMMRSQWSTPRSWSSEPRRSSTWSSACWTRRRPRHRRGGDEVLAGKHDGEFPLVYGRPDRAPGPT